MALTQFEIHYAGTHSAHNGKIFDVTAIDAAEAVALLREWLNGDSPGPVPPGYIQFCKQPNNQNQKTNEAN